MVHKMCYASKGVVFFQSFPCGRWGGGGFKSYLMFFSGNFAHPHLLVTLVMLDRIRS